MGPKRALAGCPEAGDPRSVAGVEILRAGVVETLGAGRENRVRMGVHCDRRGALQTRVKPSSITTHNIFPTRCAAHGNFRSYVRSKKFSTEFPQPCEFLVRLSFGPRRGANPRVRVRRFDP